jgi:flagellar secretion chaperone FliS
MSNAYQQYQKTEVTTASREKILLMLYEGAIRFTKRARTAMDEKKIAEKGKYISKATAIISELMATLDHKAGGELVADLESLYIYMIDKLIEANIQNKPEVLDHVENLLRTLYVAWKDIVENPRADGVPSPGLQKEEYQKYLENVKNSPDQAAAEAPEARTRGNQLKIAV